MRRRTFLGSAAIAALAGCSNGEPAETPTDASDGTRTGTPTATRTDAPTETGAADFEFESVRAPETVELNDPLGFTVRVRNVGSGRGTFTSGLSTRVGDEEWRSVEGDVSMTLDAGEAGVWESPELTPRYLTTVAYRLERFDETWATEVVPKRLSFGEHYATPTGLPISVLGGSFESTYPSGDDGTPAPDGDVWAVMRVDVRNGLEDVRPAPDASTFSLETGGERRDLDRSVTDDPYEGGDLDGRTVRRGDLVYAVPEETTADDVTATWKRSTSRGDVRAVWTT